MLILILFKLLFIQNEGGWTPAMLAVENQHIDTVIALLNAGAVPSIVDNVC